ncbi:MAG: 4Fe-4S binding protein [Burkholderiales bacterium]
MTLMLQSPAARAALSALESLNATNPFEPVASVGYTSAGRLLILADDERLSDVVSALAEKLSIAVLWVASTPPPANAALADTELSRGQVISLEGYLGAFALVWQAGAAPAAFDLVLDLRQKPHFQMHQPPQGYWHAPEAEKLSRALAELPEMVGEFEKPKFFAYKESLCAHSRSKKDGCNRCIEICSTSAITSAGDLVEVNPNLCMGCGACSTVCPSGAMRYQYPRVSDRGAQLRAMFAAFREAGGKQPALLIHNGMDGAAALADVSLADNVIPLEAWHVASIGLDLMLGAVAYGARGVVVFSAGSEAPQYAESTRAACQTGDTIMNALGYSGTHFVWTGVEQLSTAVGTISAAQTVTTPATFHLTDDKRNTIEFAIEHLMRFSANKPEAIGLTAPAMFGAIEVNKDKCTMCLACAGACPASALMDGAGELGAEAERPMLKFIERNCVQCGVCAETCPESAISLVPRLLLTPERKQARVLNETEPFNCISCGKALGTRKLIDTMLSRLSGHSMFASEGSLKRLQMCADCRVVDMMSNKHEISILTGKPIE